MPALRPVPWQVLEAFVLSKGCEFVRQKGSHRVYWRAGLLRPIIIPTYAAVPVFIIRNTLRQLDVSVAEFCGE